MTNERESSANRAIDLKTCINDIAKQIITNFPTSPAGSRARPPAGASILGPSPPPIVSFEAQDPSQKDHAQGEARG